MVYLDHCDNKVVVVRSPTLLMLMLPNVVESGKHFREFAAACLTKFLLLGLNVQ